MPFNIIDKALSGLLLIEPKAFSDDRGYFMESFKASDFEKLGIVEDFVQDNHSVSKKNTVRGLHFQWDRPMGKLLRVTRGAARFVELDIRKNSPTLGQHYTTILSEENKNLLWVPAGFGNGFLALEDNTEVLYKCTAEWNPKAESCIRWNDPELHIDWGIIEGEALLSGKDAQADTLQQWLSREESKNF
jgi:dTDP-4-dehydrorhamnose 3,5-epimerase